MLLSLQILTHHLVLPALFVWWLTGRRYVGSLGVRTRVEALTLFVALEAYLTFIVLCGAWSILSYWMRPLVFASTIVATVSFLRDFRRVPSKPSTWRSLSRALLYSTVGAYFCVLCVGGIAGHFPPEETLDLEFPLTNGVFVVGQGGASSVLNHHAAHPTQAYALDILEIGWLGTRAHGIFPDDPARYEIFGSSVLSPCDGRVAWRRDGLPDATGAQRETERPAGNAVAIECHGATVLLAHLAQGSVHVAEDDAVRVGQPIGRVGNSGNTTEPHLHIHAHRGSFEGEQSQQLALAIRFDGRFLVRGSVVWR